MESQDIVNLNAPMSIKLLKALAVGVIFAVLMSPCFFILATFDLELALGISLFLCIGFGGIMAAFVYFLNVSSLSNKNVFDSINLEQGEEILALADANFSRNQIAIGGKFIITNKAIRFSGHRGNLGLEAWTKDFKISLENIKALEIAKPQFKISEWFSGRLASHLKIIVNTNEEFDFVIDNKEKVINFINRLIKKADL